MQMSLTPGLLCLRLCVSVLSSSLSHRDGRRLSDFSVNFLRSAVTSRLIFNLCLSVFGVRSAFLGLASRFLEFVASPRAFRSWVNVNATRRREVTPQLDSDAMQHFYNRILGAKHSL